MVPSVTGLTSLFANLKCLLFLEIQMKGFSNWSSMFHPAPYSQGQKSVRPVHVFLSAVAL